MVEHESLLLLGSEAEAGREVVPEGGDLAQTHVQVALTVEMSLTSHLQVDTCSIITWKVTFAVKSVLNKRFYHL